MRPKTLETKINELAVKTSLKYSKLAPAKVKKVSRQTIARVERAAGIVTANAEATTLARAKAESE